MSFELFPTEEANALQYTAEHPSLQNEPGFWGGFASGAADLTMQGLAKTARSVDLLGAIGPIVQDKITGGTSAQDQYFQEHDNVFNNAVDYWTPNPGQVGTAAQVVGGLIPTIANFAISPSLAVGAQTLATSEDLSHENVDAARAVTAGLIQGTGLGLGAWMPILGKNLLTRVLAGGAAANVGLGVASKVATQAAIGDNPAAKQFDPWTVEGVVIDALMGAAFGGLTHLSKGDAPAKTAIDKDAILTANQARHLESNTAPGLPEDAASATTHVLAVQKAIDDLLNDREVNVDQMMAGSRFAPDPQRAAQAQEIQTELTRASQRVLLDAIGEENGQYENVAMPPELRKNNLREQAFHDIADQIRAELLPEAGNRAEPGLIADANQHLNDVNFQIEQTASIFKDLAKEFQNQKMSRKQAEAAARKQIDDHTQELTTQKTALENLITRNARAAQAEQRIAGLEKGQVPPEFEERLQTRMRQLETKQAITDLFNTPRLRLLAQDEIFKNVRDQLLAVGRDPIVANQEAALWHARVMTRAQRLGVDPLSLYRENPLKITDQSIEGRVLNQALPTKINIDGVERNVLNNMGRSIANTEQGVRNFWKWFGDSRVVDDQRRPLVVYHGSGADMSGNFAFDPNKMGSHASSEGYGFYFTTDKDIAKGYKPEKSGSVVQTYLALQKPMSVEQKPFALPDLKKIIRAMVDSEISEFSNEIADYKNTFLSNYVDTYSKSLDTSIAAVAKIIKDGNSNAVDQIAELANASGSKTLVFNATRGVTGFDGVIADGYGNLGQAGGTIYGAWFPEQIKSINNEGTFDLNDSNIFKQGADRGLYSPDKNTIALLKNADFSTFVHESGHSWLEDLRTDSLRDNAPDQIKSDFQIIKKWAGINDDNVIPTEAHEKFARGFEAYLREGKAPSKGLAAVFENFKQWLVSIYKNLSDLKVDLTADVRGVMDRLLATDEQISQRAAEALRPIEPSPPKQIQPLAENVAPLNEQMKASEVSGVNREPTINDPFALQADQHLLEHPELRDHVFEDEDGRKYTIDQMRADVQQAQADASLFEVAANCLLRNL